MIRHQPESTSEILRATDIILVRLGHLTLGPPQPGGDFLVVREVHAELNIEQILKGSLPKDRTQVVNLVFSVYANEGSRFTALPGIWSHQTISEGAQFVLFSIAGSNDPAQVLSEPQCFRCETAEEAMPDIGRASLEDTPGLTLAKLVIRSATERASFKSLFARYVAWRLREVVMANSLEDFDSILAVAESPETNDVFRRILVTEAYDLLMMLDPAPNTMLARLIWGSIRLIATENGEPMRELVLQTLLPNLIGLEGGLVRKHAPDVFAGADVQRREVEEILSARQEFPGRDQIIQWLHG